VEEDDAVRWSRQAMSVKYMWDSSISEALGEDREILRPSAHPYLIYKICSDL
jgi:hypothetical protein